MKRSVWVVSLMAVILWGAAALAPMGRAQDFVATEGQLNDDSLGKMLDSMGYEPKKLSKGWLIAIKRDTWTFNIQLVCSKDLTKVGINANLGAVKNPDAITASQWKELLISNSNIDPSCFYFDNDLKKLYMHRTMDNRGLTPSIIRVQVDNFCVNLKDTSELWKFVE